VNALAQADVEKSTYGAFERLLYIFLIPAVFTLILSGVLLSLFGYDVKDTALKMGNKIPVVHKWIPEPVGSTTEVKDNAAAVSDEKQPQDDQIAELTAAIANKEAEIEILTASAEQKDVKIEQLQKNLEQMEHKFAEKQQTEEQYAEQIRALAGMYAKMTPSKSAPILQNLTLSELVLVLSEMKPDQRVRVLEKMDPKIAAEASIRLKDVVPAKDRQIAALQERLQLYKQEDPSQTQTAKLNRNELGQTFASMAPKSAAVLLLEMMSADQNTVVSILTSMDTDSRSSILTALSELSKEDAAKISMKLAQ
jgi:flagellar motility protein MotE (MotC chaperone)